MFLLDTSKVAGDVSTAAKQLHGILERHQAKVLASRPWGDERRLAYPIGNHKKGLYYLTYFSAEGKDLKAIEGDVALNDMIIRALALKIHPKLVDTMLALARDEHALALHNVTDEPAEEAEGVAEGDAGGEGGPARRGPRRPHPEEPKG
jgi:small subunit ribosomal protein S6